MIKRGMFLVCFFAVAGCAQLPLPKEKDKDVAHGIVASPATVVGTLDGALITEDIQANPGATAAVESTSNNLIIVQCPACNQRVDVTGLPRQNIRCPNCNSLFTY